MKEDMPLKEELSVKMDLPVIKDFPLKEELPVKKGKPKWFKFTLQIFQRFGDDDISALSAQLTYYLILSLFPFLVFLINALSYISLSYLNVINSMLTFMPNDISVLINNLLTETIAARSVTLLLLGALLTIWSAAQGINAMRKGFNKAYNLEESRPFWKVSGFSILFTIGIVLVIIITIMFLVSGKVFGNYVFGLVGASKAFVPVWILLRYSVPLIVMILVFSLYYKFIPNRKSKWKEIFPGAVFATLGWIGTSMLFSFYVNSFGGFTRVYGSLGGIIILLVWLYFSSIIILLGGEINAALCYFRCNTPIAKYEDYRISIPLLKRRTDIKKKKGK